MLWIRKIEQTYQYVRLLFFDISLHSLYSIFRSRIQSWFLVLLRNTLMPYSLSLLLISVVGVLLFWKRINVKVLSQTNYVGVINTYRGLERIALACVLLSFVALVVSVMMMLQSYTFGIGWIAISFVQVLFWLFIYFAFIKPALHDFEKRMQWMQH